MEAPKPGQFLTLPRGGYLVDSSEGYLQVGSPPETIKDTMGFPKGVPLFFCLPAEFFNRTRGIAVAEVEFPLYFNFFIRKKKTTLLCSEAQKKLFTVVLNESLFGPEQFNIANDFDEESGLPVPDLKAEMAFFRGPLNLDHLVEFRTFDAKGEVKLGGVTVRMTANHDFEIEDAPFHPAPVRIPGTVEYQDAFDLGAVSSTPFEPPNFGVTCLGPSHGFDPTANTSGFILWVNKRGIMVDPPVNSTSWLVRAGVNPLLVDSVILTHTHADHDAGTFQKILEGERVTIYTTQTVMNSWLTKYAALTGMAQREISQLFDFHPVLIGQKVNLNGAWFVFNYSLHSLPTVAFRFSYRDKSFLYTSDHLNFPDTLRTMREKGAISAERYDELTSFPWETDIIYHEAGVPPLHTPVAWLNSLPEEVQKRITVYHIAKKDFPEKTHLRLATYGLANSLIVDVQAGSYEPAFRILDILSRIEIFQHFNLAQARDLVAVVNHEKIPRGERIITKGTPGDKFYIILSGSIRIGEGAGTEAKRYGNYQTFGEVSILLNKPRTADVYAETEVEALTIGKSAFLNLFAGTEVERKLKRSALNRSERSWEALSATELFLKLSASQKTDLELILEPVEVREDTDLVELGKPVHDLYIFHSGSGEIHEKDGRREPLARGRILGAYREFDLGLPSTQRCSAKKGALVFRLGADAFRKFIKKNPGVYLRFFEALTK
ncbi:MAG: cyclic nucleotide-binding domain-containing protein [Spirochaetes bacterium]|nr:cyclic nucleotide-binding domain-containing protein [Spirochaetota bacterium]